jgi:hypothetical protein
MHFSRVSAGPKAIENGNAVFRKDNMPAELNAYVGSFGKVKE